MAICAEGKLGILAGLAGIGGAGAIMVWPDHIEIGWTLIGIASVGGIMLGSHHFLDVGRGRKQRGRMVALAEFIVFGLASLVCGYWYLRPLIVESGEPRKPDTIAVARLAELGWGVQPEQGTTRFTTSSKPLPPMGPPRFDIAPLHNLTNLRRLGLSGLGGFGMSALSAVNDSETLGELGELRTLTLGQIAITDLSFARRLHNLEELNMASMPITSIEPMRGLSNLKKIAMPDINVVDISPLLGLPRLSEVTLIRVPARSDVLILLQRHGVKVNSY